MLLAYLVPLAVLASSRVYVEEILEPPNHAEILRPIGLYFGLPPTPLTSRIHGCTDSDGCCAVIYRDLIRAVRHRHPANTRTNVENLGSDWPISSFDAAILTTKVAIDPATRQPHYNGAMFWCSDLRPIPQNLHPRPFPEDGWSHMEHTAGPWWFRCQDGYKVQLDRSFNRLQMLKNEFVYNLHGLDRFQASQSYKAKCVPFETKELVRKRSALSICRDLTWHQPTGFEGLLVRLGLSVLAPF